MERSAGHPRQSGLRAWGFTLVLVTALVLSAGLGGAGASTDAGTGSAWLRLDTPAEGTHLDGPAALVEVRGRAGRGVPGGLDVAILLDLSGSTWLASGVDVDGDGEVGRVRGRVRQLLKRGIATTRLDYTHFSSDPGDSVRAAEVSAARRLVAQLDRSRTRVALVEFDESARVVAGLGSPPQQLESALARIESEEFASLGGTDFGAALRAAVELLGEARPLAAQRLVLLLSDGQPTLPVSEHRAAREALDAARAAAAAGVRVDTFALGAEERELPVFREMAELTGGVMTRTQEAGEILAVLPGANLAGVDDVSVHNLTADLPARALRVFPDGSFDGFAPLVAGRNELRCEVHSAAGGDAVVDRTLFFESHAPADPDEAHRQRVELEALLERLRGLTLETQLRQELEAARREAQRRELELAPE